jgi:RHS repeat-associated protein
MAWLFPANRRLSPVVAAITVAGLLVLVPGSGPLAGWRPPAAGSAPGVAVQPVPTTNRPTWSAAGREVHGNETVRWPASGAVVVDLAGTRRAATEPSGVGARRARAGDLPVLVATASGAAPASAATVGKVGVAVQDRAGAASAGVGGVVLAVRRADGVAADGAVEVTVDYSGFARAYGGDWASRLRLVTVPDGRPLRTDNDPTTSTVSAVVPLAASGAATTLAVTAGPASDNGDYSATSLSPAATWQVSRQTGAFTWQYPLRMPPAVGGPSPSLALSYSSSSVDGRTGGTNTQGSWIGDGWDMWPGFIERRYVACANDKAAVGGEQPNNANVFGGDQCWANTAGNATLSLNGRATELVKSAGGTWKGVADDGSKIELRTDDTFANGDDTNEYWKVTTIDGTQYFFGRNRRPGWTTGKAETNSVWTVPVYGNHPNEPGYSAGDFAASRRTQAWRWNLDYVVDPHGNSLTYFYQREGGAYGREGDPGKRTTYDRGGWLDSVEYGTRSSTEYTVPPAAKVLIDEADRCVSPCFAGGDPVTANWKDTPWDQYCKAAPCTDQLAPTFWTQKRINKIRTQVHRGGGSYSDVESWTLAHEYLDAGNNEGRPMWLRGVTRTGHVTTAGGTTVSDPQIVFDPGADPLPNRVDGPSDGRSKLARWRIATITTESGAQISPKYSAVECTRASLPAPATNTKRCFPQYYAPEGETPTLDWFHKYVVERIDVHDQTGGSADEQTHYDYLDTPAWHYDDSELVEEKKRTWGQFRGYGKVRVRKGLTTGTQSAMEFLYLRGMDGDKQTSGTRDVWVADSQGRQVEDHEAFAGMLLEETTLLGFGGTWISGTVNTPVKQGPTATSGPLKAWMTAVGTERTRTRLADSSTRWTKTVTTFNADNLPTQVDDFGDEVPAADDRCTRTWYARNASNWMLDKVKRVETVGVNCGATPALPADMLSSSRTTYDAENNNWDTDLPVFGNVARVEEIDSWNGTTPVWLTTSRSTYDDNGRVTQTWDALNRRDATSYTPATAGPVTEKQETNPLGHTVTTTVEPAYDLPVSIADANGARTDLTYDGLGRLLKVWQPGRNKATQLPNFEFTYLVRNNAPTAITTRKLQPNGTSQRTSIVLYDGLLRQRQTQTQATGGGRTLSDTVYDSRGLLEWRSAEHYDESNTPPNTTLVTSIGQAVIPSTTTFEYDGAERKIAEVQRHQGAALWRTTTGYAGERTNVTPPAGGTATTTIVDARGRTVELRQYRSHADVGSDNASTYDKTTYGYTDRDELARVTDAAGNTWRYAYDQRGRQVRTEDPDEGVSVAAYDAAGQRTADTDARGFTLAYTHDALGRKTSTRDGSALGPKRAEWFYDTLANGVGKLSRSARYDPAGSTNAYINEVIGYDSAGRSTGNRVTIPGWEGTLCAAGGATPCSFAFPITYRADGQLATTTLPAVAGLPGETMVYNQNDVGAPTTMLSGLGTYVYSVVYNKVGQLTQRTLGTVGKRTTLTYTVDEVTQRLAETLVSPENKPSPAKLNYDYDEAGNLTSVVDTPFGQSPDRQCYRYDHLRRLTEAWTPTGPCPTAPTVAGLGGPAPYWHSYTYDAVGNRTSETRHGASDTVATYSYPPAGGGPGSKPHAVSRVEWTGAVTGTQHFGYDATGNTTCRPAGGAANTCSPDSGAQALGWDSEARLATSVDASGPTSFVYDADGSRLIRRDPAGTTLYLPGGTEVRKPTSGSVTATRYYTHLDRTIAVRTTAGVTWLVGDHHNTAEIALSGTDLSVARRRTLPFGGTRGTGAGSWPTGMDKGFVGGTVDNTGLVHLGAREYDPVLGRFVSLDPVMDTKDPQQMHGYAYANNAPTRASDATGFRPLDDDGDGRGSSGASSGGGSSGASSGGGSSCTGMCSVYRDHYVKQYQTTKRPPTTRPPTSRPPYTGPWIGPCTTCSVPLSITVPKWVTIALSAVNDAGQGLDYVKTYTRDYLAGRNDGRLYQYGRYTLAAMDEGRDNAHKVNTMFRKNQYLIDYGSKFKYFSKAGGPLLALGGVLTYAEQVSTGHSEAEAVTAAVVSTALGYGGAIAGAKAGMVIGSFFGPPVGTVVGGALGAAVGGFIASEAGTAVVNEVWSWFD